MGICLFDILFNFFAWFAYAISVKENDEKTIIISLVFLIPFLYEVGKNLFITKKKIWGFSFGLLIISFLSKILFLSDNLNTSLLLKPIISIPIVGLPFNSFPALYGAVITFLIPLFRLSK